MNSRNKDSIQNSKIESSELSAISNIKHTLQSQQNEAVTSLVYQNGLLNQLEETNIQVKNGCSIDGKFLSVNGERFWIKGVSYGTFRTNGEGEPYPSHEKAWKDFNLMCEAGINTVRLYSPPPDWLADAAAKVGLFLIPDICWGPRRCEIDNSERLKLIFEWTREHTRRLAGHPAILMYSIGNEIPPLIVRWYGKQRVEDFLCKLFELVKEEAPNSIITYINHPPTEYLELPFLDVIGYNIYLERELELRKYLSRLQILSGDRPLFLSELGLDSKKHGEIEQAKFLDWQLRAAYEKGLCGAVVYSWTDEWGIFNSHIEGWEFGLTDAERSPKMAYDAVSSIFHSDIYGLRIKPWPFVSVVVCCYNSSATLEECLKSLLFLRYPRYEIIVIDDGSTDGTHKIAERYNIRCIRVQNGGLSNARNLGIEVAGGEIVAFIDSDAYANPDWLYYLIMSLEENSAFAVGGPNLSPPEDGFIAQCVDHAPGNPTCVLIDNERAEHVPGCNMAFRKEAFEIVGMFDPNHNAAGDDVDMCWRLLVSDKTIAYSPSAVVWHHRRDSVSGYLRQQKGYGYAEAFLQRRYPGRFNLFGYPVWKGGVYDSVHTTLREHGLPAVFRPAVYRGQFGSAQFQSIYQPFQSWWFQIFTTAEWQLLAACATMAGFLALWQEPLAGIGISFAALLMVAATIISAVLAGFRGDRAKRWTGAEKWRRIAVISALHILQPLARTAGRVRGWWRLREDEIGFPAMDILEGDLTKRHIWLERLQEYMRSCGWIVQACDDWDDSDLEILGPGPYRLKLSSVYEEYLEKARYLVRYRITARMKSQMPFIVGVLLLILAGIVHVSYLLPLALPISLTLWRYLRAKRNMIRSVSQMAMECGWPLGMQKAKD